MSDLADKARRAMAGRSYADIARLMGNKPENVRKWIDGSTMPLFVAGVQFCLALGIDPAWLADDSQDWPPPETVEDKTAELVGQALAGAGLAGELTDDERQLLSRWRQLNDRQQGRVLGMVEGLGEAAAEAADEVPPHERIVLDKVADLVRRELDKQQDAAAAKQQRGAG